MHYHFIEDEKGDLIEVLEFCSDSCNREHNGEDYAGWNGCHEAEFDTLCTNCRVEIKGFRRNE